MQSFDGHKDMGILIKEPKVKEPKRSLGHVYIIIQRSFVHTMVYDYRTVCPNIGAVKKTSILSKKEHHLMPKQMPLIMGENAVCKVKLQGFTIM